MFFKRLLFVSKLKFKPNKIVTQPKQFIASQLYSVMMEQSFYLPSSMYFRKHFFLFSLFSLMSASSYSHSYLFSTLNALLIVTKKHSRMKSVKDSANRNCIVVSWQSQILQTITDNLLLFCKQYIYILHEALEF